MMEKEEEKKEEEEKVFDVQFEDFEFEDEWLKFGGYTGYTLFLQAMSAGIVGQLTTDLILQNLPRGGLKKIGRIFSSALEPVVGTDIVESNNGLMTACEVFLASDLKYVIIHFLSPVLKRGRAEFVKGLVDWIRDVSFKQVVCFSSILASDRIDSQLCGSQFRYLSTFQTPEPLIQKFKEMEWKELENRQFPAPALVDSGTPLVETEEQLRKKKLDEAKAEELESRGISLGTLFNNNSSLNDEDHEWLIRQFHELQLQIYVEALNGFPSHLEEVVPHLPGGGITKLLFEGCQSQQTAFIALVMFVSEGDNASEAMTMFQMADSVFGFRPSKNQRDKPIVPISWANFGEESRPSLS